jgi:hypothetical protein
MGYRLALKIPKDWIVFLPMPKKNVLALVYNKAAHYSHTRALGHWTMDAGLELPT